MKCPICKEEKIDLDVNNDGIELEEGSNFIINDHRGFPIFKVKEKTGHLYIKGTLFMDKSLKEILKKKDKLKELLEVFKWNK